MNVHHIVPEAKAGTNDINNAIILCFRCHAEAGHYNSLHPLGDKYSPEELRQHRDEWWRYCESYNKNLRPENVKCPAVNVPGGEELELFEKEIGTLWSRYSNMPAQSEIVRFEGRFLTETETENMNGLTWYELYELKNGRFAVYIGNNHRGDWCTADLAGVNAWEEVDPPLTLHELQERYPMVAKAAGLVRVREFQLDE